MKENKYKIIQQKQSVIKENESELLKEKMEKKNFKIEIKNLNNMIGEDKVTEKKINKIFSSHSKINIIVKLK